MGRGKWQPCLGSHEATKTQRVITRRVALNSALTFTLSPRNYRGAGLNGDLSGRVYPSPSMQRALALSFI
jgi:hypothetical protein